MAELLKIRNDSALTVTVPVRESLRRTQKGGSDQCLGCEGGVELLNSILTLFLCLNVAPHLLYLLFKANVAKFFRD